MQMSDCPLSEISGSMTLEQCDRYVIITGTMQLSPRASQELAGVHQDADANSEDTLWELERFRDEMAIK